MAAINETYRNDLVISTNQQRLDIDAICEMLENSYWASSRSRETIRKSIENSLVFGIYSGKIQIDFARVISDFATFAYLCDVFIVEEYRGRGIGKWLIETIISYPNLHEIRKFILATRDAHDLYAQYGFRGLSTPENMMEKTNG